MTKETYSIIGGEFNGKLAKSLRTHCRNALLKAVSEGDGRTACAVWHFADSLSAELKNALTAHYTESKGHKFPDGCGQIRVISATAVGSKVSDKLLPLSKWTPEQIAAGKALGVIETVETVTPAKERQVVLSLTGYTAE